MELVIATLDRFEDFYDIKCDNNNVFWTGWNEIPNHDNLKSFYDKVLNEPNTKKTRKIYFGVLDNKVIGYIYIDYVDENTFHLSPAIHSNYQGKGYGKKIIELGIKEGLRLGFKNMEAYIREDNIVSQKCFEANGAKMTNIYRMQYIKNLNKEIKMIKYYYESE